MVCQWMQRREGARVETDGGAKAAAWSTEMMPLVTLKRDGVKQAVTENSRVKRSWSTLPGFKPHSPNKWKQRTRATQHSLAASLM
jgi:hypothetical protein